MIASTLFGFISLVLVEANEIKSEPKVIKALTYNVWNLGSAGGHYTEQRLRAICGKFKEAAVDPNGWGVIFIQELWPQSHRNALKNCGYKYVAHVENYTARYNNLILWGIGLLYGDTIDTGMRILSKYPLGKPKRHTYSENGYFFDAIEDGDWLAAKSAMAVPMYIPGAKTVWLVNTHLVSTNSSNNYHKQRQIQLRELSIFVDKVARDEPVIMGGDFNLSPRGPRNERNPMANIWLWKEFFRVHFRDFQLVDPSGGVEVDPTYSRKNSWAKREDGWQRLDHIFINRYLEPIESKVVFREKVNIKIDYLEREEHRRHLTKVSRGKGTLNVNLSDHYGFEATVSLKR